MSSSIIDASVQVNAARAIDDPHARRRIGISAIGGAIYVYLLILFGAFVRLSGSGLGCGDDWPRCNGTWMPAWDFTTWVEWGHRLLGAGALIPFGLVVGAIYIGRGSLGDQARPLTRMANWLVGLLVVQALLGATTVKLDLSPPVTAVHFVLANILLALFITIAIRALQPGLPRDTRPASLVKASAIIALIAIFLGALTANGGAALACQGFPLCNGTALPMGNTAEATRMLHTHWVHRLLAYALFFLVSWAGWSAFRRPSSSAVRRIALTAMALLFAQVGVGIGLVLLHLPMGLRSLHVVFGVALFAVLVMWLLLARRSDVYV